MSAYQYTSLLGRGTIPNLPFVPQVSIKSFVKERLLAGVTPRQHVYPA
ncbi:TPA: hypothetical protein QCO63_000851 [Bacillus anthracis]|nr:hypothetical protein KM392_10560 [Bacillus anthracis]HDR4010671.1 hypothetical protein [Bacillus anthracis]HDR4244099.1 hypothetical protein [Bacillus anthracis]